MTVDDHIDLVNSQAPSTLLTFLAVSLGSVVGPDFYLTIDWFFMCIPIYDCVLLLSNWIFLSVLNSPFLCASMCTCSTRIPNLLSCTTRLTGHIHAVVQLDTLMHNLHGVATQLCNWAVLKKLAQWGIGLKLTGCTTGQIHVVHATK